jgi:hypothetical protein
VAAIASGQANSDLITANTTALNASGQKNKDNYDYGFATSGITYANGADNRIATFSDTNALNGEANLTFDGSTLTYIGYLGSGLTIADDGSITASGDITTSGIVNASGMSVSGLYLADYVPTSTSNRLYNEGGTLKFDGSAVGGGGGSSRSVAGDADNAIITWVTSDNTFAAESTFLYDGGTVSLSGDILADGNITLGSSGTLISSGVASSGLRLGTYTPLETNETLYN